MPHKTIICLFIIRLNFNIKIVRAFATFAMGKVDKIFIK